jgi:hypothetical protein
MDEVKTAIEGPTRLSSLSVPTLLSPRSARRRSITLPHTTNGSFRSFFGEADDVKVPQPAARNWICFRDRDDLRASSETLLRALDTDPEWAHLGIHLEPLSRAWSPSPTQIRGEESSWAYFHDPEGTSSRLPSGQRNRPSSSSHSSTPRWRDLMTFRRDPFAPRRSRLWPGKPEVLAPCSGRSP